jgi:hypothetical protein
MSARGRLLRRWEASGRDPEDMVVELDEYEADIRVDEASRCDAHAAEAVAAYRALLRGDVNALEYFDTVRKGPTVYRAAVLALIDEQQ